MTYSLDSLSTSPSPARTSPQSGLARFASELGLVIGLVALGFWLLSLASYAPTDPAWSTSGTGAELRNRGGRLGALLADNPNTGAQSVPGHVNFIINVNYNGSPAQAFVGNVANNITIGVRP